VLGEYLWRGDHLIVGCGHVVGLSAEVWDRGRSVAVLVRSGNTPILNLGMSVPVS